MEYGRLVLLLTMQHDISTWLPPLSIPCGCILCLRTSGERSYEPQVLRPPNPTPDLRNLVGTFKFTRDSSTRFFLNVALKITIFSLFSELLDMLCLTCLQIRTVHVSGIFFPVSSP